MAKRIAVFGAEGATGREVVRQAAAAGHAVRASDRAPGTREPLPPDVEGIPADLLSADLRPIVAGMDAVVSAVGVPRDPRTLLDPPPLYTDGTRRIMEAMRAEGVRRLVVISAAFVHQRDLGPVLFRTAVIPSLRNVLAQMEAMEAMLRAAGDEWGLDWTAVRPGWLMRGEATGDAWVGPDAIPPGLIRTRHGDLAALLIDCATTGAWSRATPAIARDEPDLKESSAQVVLEMLA